MNTTRERKPFCAEHVQEHPYINDLMRRLADSEREVARVKQRGAKEVDTQGLLAREILRELAHGDRTVERLARDMQIDPSVVDCYVRALARRGRVTLGETSRGNVLVAASGSRRRRSQRAS
jgi:hypothetical protein